jgi:hypothetical protein
VLTAESADDASNVDGGSLVKRVSVVVVVLVVGCFARLAAQQRAADPSVSAVARAWTAIAEGRPADGARAADEALRTAPRNHEAVNAKIAALALGEPLRALDAYEAWLRRTEDVFLLEPIARGVLAAIAGGNDVALQISALEELARAGGSAARDRLAQLQASKNPAAGAALARLGDQQARTALIASAQSGASPEAAAELLDAAGPGAVPVLRQLLKHPAPPVRADAAAALGKLKASDAVDDLRSAMTDPNPLVSASAAVALTRLGDHQGEAKTQQMLESDLPDFRLMAAEAYIGRGSGPWVAAITPLLRDENALTRLRAASLIAPVDPDAAREVLMAGARDPNPVIRSEALRMAGDQPASSSIDIPVLRRALRDTDATVRMRAAEAILAIIAS